jgi:hypothetical protein
MEISKFFETFTLHDRVVNKVTSFPEEKRLKLEIELCNYDQRGFREGDPEMVSGSLVFSGVEEFKADPSIDDMQWGNEFDGEISTYGHVPERDKNGLQASEFVLYCDNYKTHNHTILILSFLASSAEWRPLSTLSPMKS